MTKSCGCHEYLLLPISIITIEQLRTGEVGRILDLSCKPNTLETKKEIDSHVAREVKIDFKSGNSDNASTYLFSKHIRYLSSVTNM